MRITSGFSGDQRSSWQVDLRLVIIAFVALFGFFAMFAYQRRGAAPASLSSAAERLQPITNASGSGVVRRTVAMVGRSANVGISFTSIGRVVTNEAQ